MEFIFWQGVLSIHQSSFIKALSSIHKVTLAVQSDLSYSRKRQGWSVPDMGKAKIIVNPTVADVDRLLQSDNAYNVFSGFYAFPQATFAMERLRKEGRKFSILIEPFEWAGVKGMIRYIKYFYLKIKYNSNIHRLFVTGIKAQKEYETCGFDSNKIRQWGYFTSELNSRREALSAIAEFRVVFVGSLNKNKNIENLIIAVLPLKNVSLDIIGSGPLFDFLKETYSNPATIRFHGNIPNELVQKFIAESDLLVLPSHYDGWGAVVNEALTVGTPTLVSENCGSSILVGKDGVRGEIFDLKHLQEALERQISRGKVTLERRNRIIAWAHENLSGKVAAEYFCHAIMDDCVQAPWMKNA